MMVLAHVPSQAVASEDSRADDDAFSKEEKLSTRLLLKNKRSAHACPTENREKPSKDSIAGDRARRQVSVYE